jgi:hypothetical protein
MIHPIPILYYILSALGYLTLLYLTDMKDIINISPMVLLPQHLFGLYRYWRVE